MLFPKWTNYIFRLDAILVSAGIGLVMVIGVIWYWAGDNHLVVGYEPVQPIVYSHKLHVNDLGIDCRFCHTGAEYSPVAGIPSTEICMGCHTMILPESPEIVKLKKFYESSQPVPWVRVHKLPDYAYFDHSAHLNKGVGCVECHGRVDQMVKMRQDQSLSMLWCIECHLSPQQSLGEKQLITMMDPKTRQNSEINGSDLMEQYHINTRIDCSACHR